MLTAKGIKNDFILLISDSFDSKTKKGFNKVVKFLSEIGSRKNKFKAHTERNGIVQKHLKICKTLGVPVVRVKELHLI